MMKVRFGVSLGTDVGPEALADVVDRLEADGVDSLWFSELVYSPAIDPTVGMAFALARTRHLKVGTSVAVLPGRHPVLVAKQLLSMAALAPKRVLPVFGLRPALPVERDLFVVPEGKRAAVFDESLTLLRRVLRDDAVTFAGEFFSVRDASITPKPAAPLDVWLGGSSPAGYRRIGTHADGWLGSFLTPDETRTALADIRAAAEQAGRHVPDDHFGINVAVGTGDLPAPVRAAVHARRPDLDPAELVASDWPALHAMLDGYIAAGLTKFVIRPLGSTDTGEFLNTFVKEILPRQN